MGFRDFLGGNSKKHRGYYDQYRAYLETPGRPVWSKRSYTQFAGEAYSRNVIALRSISMIAEAAASIAVRIFYTGKTRQEITAGPLFDLIKKPNPQQNYENFVESIYSYRLISGNSYILAIGSGGPVEVYALRPDRVSIIPDKTGAVAAYRYQNGEKYTDYPVDRVTGRSQVLHFKTFNPLSDWYGLSPIEAAAYSIDQHNQSGAWNQALLQNGARPSGALVVRGDNNYQGTLSEEQYSRLKAQIDQHFSGPENAGRPILLEGGLDWKEMSISPRDMDFINAKHSAARDIALAFGVPPQLLGIPGDNTYSNYSEARLAFWEETVIPLADSFVRALNCWLVPMFGKDLEIILDLDSVPALAPRREALWNRISNAAFLSEEQKRTLLRV